MNIGFSVSLDRQLVRQRNSLHAELVKHGHQGIGDSSDCRAYVGQLVYAGPRIDNRRLLQ